MTGFLINGICEAISVSVNKTAISSPFQCRIGDMCNYTLTYSNSLFDRQPCICSGLEGYVGYCSNYVINDYNYAIAMYANLDYTSSNCGGIHTSTLDPGILLECGSISKSSYYQFINVLYTGYY